TDDPMHKMIVKYRLPCLLVEPLLDLYERLCATYLGQAGVQFENCAVAWENGERTLYRVEEQEGVPAWAVGMAGFDRQVLVKHKNQIPDIEKYITSVSVKTMTMDRLLAAHGIREVGLLQVDTEGYDFEIIQMCFAAQ